MTNLIVKGNEVKVSQDGRITYIYEVENTDVKSLIEGLNKQTDENSDDRLSVDEILYK